MNKRLVVALATAAALAIMAGVWVMNRPAPAPSAVNIVSTRRAEPKSTNVEVAVANPSSTAGEPSAQTTDIAPRASLVAEGVPLPGDSPTVLSPEELAEKFLVEDFTDPDVVAKFLEEYGTIGDLYRAAPKESREELIDYLIDQEQLRAELASILPAEEDSAMRSYILDRVEPDGFFDSEREEDLDNPEIDDELIALLENPTATPIGREEWLSRMELAHLIDDQYALNWVRDGLDVFPGDKDVALLAHALTLTIGATLGNLSNEELNQSSDYLYSTLGGAAFATYNSDQRIRAYYALYWVPDRASSAAFYTATLAVESDPRARDVLTGLIDRINSQAAAGH